MLKIKGSGSQKNLLTDQDVQLIAWSGVKSVKFELDKANQRLIIGLTPTDEVQTEIGINLLQVAFGCEEGTISLQRKKPDGTWEQPKTFSLS